MRTWRTEESWYEPLLSAHTLDDALGAVDPTWAEDVIHTTAAALEALTPLAGNTPVVRAPTFAGSVAVGGADADLILGRTLLEVKTVRSASLAKRDLQQVVTYSLLDWDDQFGLDEVAMLAARHGVLVRWPLEELVAAASRGKFTLADVRAQLQSSLTAPRR